MASYRKGVAYIALNDEPMILSAEEMQGYASVHVLGEAFDKTNEKVAQDVIDYRLKYKGEQ